MGLEEDAPRKAEAAAAAGPRGVDRGAKAGAGALGGVRRGARVSTLRVAYSSTFVEKMAFLPVAWTA